jgi:hypothetical protein
LSPIGLHLDKGETKRPVTSIYNAYPNGIELYSIPKGEGSECYVAGWSTYFKTTFLRFKTYLFELTAIALMQWSTTIQSLGSPLQIIYWIEAEACPTEKYEELIESA